MAEEILCPITTQARSERALTPALIWGRRRLSWEQFDQCVATTVTQLKEFAFVPEQRVVIATQTHVELVVLLFALWRLNIVAVPLNPQWSDDMILDVVRRVDAHAVIVDDDARVAFFKKEIKQTRVLRDCISFDINEVGHRSADLHRTIKLDQLATIVTTSGSTGTPKLAVHSYRNHYANALGANECVPLDKEDRWLLSLGCHHVAGLGVLFRCVLSGAAIVMDELTDAALLKRGVTHVSLVLTQCQALLCAEQADLVKEQLKCILLGGGPVKDAFKERLLEEGWSVYMTYGMTEAASQLATSKLTQVGQGARVLPYRELDVVDEEVCFKGDVLFQGYWAQGGVERELDENGLFHTGDLGQWRDGEIVITGRKDNMFVSGGENIHPEEVERALLKINGIVSAVVIDVEDEQFGHVGVAFVSIDDKTILDDVATLCREQLPAYKVPKQFYHWPEDVPDDVKRSRAILKKLYAHQHQQLMLI